MFAAGVSVQRLRRPRVTDAINPAKQSFGLWADAIPLTIGGAYVAGVSSFAAADPARSQVTSTKSLYCSPDADVQVGDRIVSGSHTYEVTAVPESDISPFTGWRPIQEVPLQEVLG